MDASPAWLDEHTRQAFRPRAISMLPDLEASVFQSALALNGVRFSDSIVWQVAAVFLPLSAPVQFDARRLVEVLLAPIREKDDREQFDLPEAEEVAQVPNRFSERDLDLAQGMLDEVSANGTFLSEILARSRVAGDPELMQTLLYLLGLRDSAISLCNA